MPLIDSGIYVCGWSARRFVSVILYTCAEFDDGVATETTRDFFALALIYWLVIRLVYAPLRGVRWRGGRG